MPRRSRTADSGYARQHTLHMLLEDPERHRSMAENGSMDAPKVEAGAKPRTHPLSQRPDRAATRPSGECLPGQVGVSVRLGPGLSLRTVCYRLFLV